MSFNLVDAAKGLFSNELIGKASAYLGETESGISKAISGIVPSLLGGVADKATSSADGAATVEHIAREADDSAFLGNLGSFFDNDGSGSLNKGSGLLHNLFGDAKSSLVSSLISQFAGVKTSSSNSLLNMAAAAILGMLGRHAKSNNLDASGLASMLSSQKSNIMNAMPAGLNLGSVFTGWGGGHITEARETAHATTQHAHAHSTHHHDDDNGGGGLKFIFPIILLALLGSAVWYFTKDGCRSNGHDDSATTTGHTDTTMLHDTNTSSMAAGRLDTASGDFIYDAGETMTIQLPNNGGSMMVGKNSTEYKLVRFLNDANVAVDSVKGNWFEFTNVRFDKGGSNVTTESLAQLRNLVTISKAYPNATFKIGGYTDNTGNAASNLSLSQKRADAVAARLKELGIAAAAITGAEGYGQEWPIADNSTPEGQAQNRRVAVNVKSK